MEKEKAPSRQCPKSRRRNPPPAPQVLCEVQGPPVFLEQFILRATFHALYLWMEEEKEKFPRADAEKLADHLMALRYKLGDFSERWTIAGSIRRKKAFVSDVEVVYIPIFDERPKKVEPSAQMDLGIAPKEPEMEEFAYLDEAIEVLIGEGILEKRRKKDGAVMFGKWVKLLRHVRTGIPIDFFACTADGWWTTLVSRTGGKDSNLELATRALRLGYTWNPGGRGFTSLSDGSVVAVDSEEAAFQFVGMPCLPPELRA